MGAIGVEQFMCFPVTPVSGTTRLAIDRAGRPKKRLVRKILVMCQPATASASRVGCLTLPPQSLSKDRLNPTLDHRPVLSLLLPAITLSGLDAREKNQHVLCSISSSRRREEHRPPEVNHLLFDRFAEAQPCLNTTSTNLLITIPIRMLLMLIMVTAAALPAAPSAASSRASSSRRRTTIPTTNTGPLSTAIPICNRTLMLPEAY